MANKYKILPFFIIPNFIFSHGVREGTKLNTLIDCLREGAIHMITGYDHILFLIGVVFFLKNYIDIFKFITAFTIAHCITLIFATLFEIRANAYLIDAVIAFSVIYKGFENLDGFKKWFSKKPPNLILMVFIFGLIHGFGLSTKLQEMAGTSLSVSQILSFNVGVELGQIGALLIVFPLLSLVRKQGSDYFEKISKISNWGLVLSGIFLLIFQLNGYFSSEKHHHHNENKNVQQKEKNKIPNYNLLDSVLNEKTTNQYSPNITDIVKNIGSNQNDEEIEEKENKNESHIHKDGTEHKH